MRLAPDQELEGNDAGALVDELEEGMLAVGAGLAPHHRPRLFLDRCPVAGDALAVRFHIELLEIGGKPRQPLIVGNDGPRRIA